MKKINVGQRIQNKDIGQRIKSIEKKTVASTVIYICLLLQKKIGISFIVFNSYFSCQFSYPVGVDRKKKKKKLKIQYFSFGCSFTFPVGDAIIFSFFLIVFHYITHFFTYMVSMKTQMELPWLVPWLLILLTLNEVSWNPIDSLLPIFVWIVFLFLFLYVF